MFILTPTHTYTHTCTHTLHMHTHTHTHTHTHIHTDSFYGWHYFHHWRREDIQVFLPVTQVERCCLLLWWHIASADRLAHHWNVSGSLRSISALWVSMCSESKSYQEGIIILLPQKPRMYNIATSYNQYA